MLKRNRTGNGHVGFVAACFVVEEKEQFVFAAVEDWAALAEMGERQWTADFSAILMALKPRSRNAASVIEKSVCGEFRSSIVLIQRTVIVICTALRRHVDLTAAASPL